MTRQVVTSGVAKISYWCSLIFCGSHVSGWQVCITNLPQCSVQANTVLGRTKLAQCVTIYMQDERTKLASSSVGIDVHTAHMGVHWVVRGFGVNFQPSCRLVAVAVICVISIVGKISDKIWVTPKFVSNGAPNLDHLEYKDEGDQNCWGFIAMYDVSYQIRAGSERKKNCVRNAFQ